MKIDFGKNLIGYDGEVLTTQKEPGNNASELIELTLRLAATRALVIMLQDDRNLAGEEKFKRDQLARKIWHSSGETECAVDELVLVKTLIGKTYGPAVVGAAWPILDGTGQSPATKEA